MLIVVGGFVVLDGVVVLDGWEVVSVSEAVLEADVSQLSSHKVALSMLDEEAVVPVRAKLNNIIYVQISTVFVYFSG